MQHEPDEAHFIEADLDEVVARAQRAQVLDVVGLGQLGVARSGPRLSGRSSAVSVVLQAIIPQPMSTPTAAGMMAFTVGITEPTVAPMPKCTSGMAATCLNTMGRRAAFVSWRFASSSTGTPRVHILMGTPPGTSSRM